ncbi:MAG: hypothetical protein AMJ75_01695 [Phycisphaerae bacterium SM1_79]|nr:MAG: hypothetical protein AMJ75_01695 [Phycisphaerae bacterium SM1_79]
MVSKSYKTKKPCKRWFLGYSEFEIRTALSVQRVLEKLSENVAQKSQLFKLKEKPFLGYVDSKGFVIRYNNSRKLRVYVNIGQEVKGSILVVTMREDLGPIVAFFLCVVVAATIFFLKGKISLIRVLPFYAAIFLGLRMLLYIFFRFDAASVRRKLFQILV